MLLVIIVSSCVEWYVHLKPFSENKDFVIVKDSLKINNEYLYATIYAKSAGIEKEFNPTEEAFIFIEAVFKQETMLFQDSIVIIDSLEKVFYPLVYIGTDYIENNQFSFQPNTKYNITLNFGSHENIVTLPIELKISKIYDVKTDSYFKIEPIYFKYP